MASWLGLALALTWFVIHTSLWISVRVYFGLAEALRRRLRRYLRAFRPRNGIYQGAATTTRRPRYLLIVDTQ